MSSKRLSLKQIKTFFLWGKSPNFKEQMGQNIQEWTK